MKYIVAIFIIVLTSGCANSNTDLNVKEKKLINESIKHIINLESDKKMQDCYLVNPYYIPFSYENYSEKTKSILRNKIVPSSENSIETNEQIDGKDFKVFNTYLSKLSKCDESYYILSFSKLGKNLMFGQLTVSNKISNIKQFDFKDVEPTESTLFAFLIDENYKITEVIDELIIYN